ncbi:indole-3-glycerol phosphate synthase TrpC [Thermoflavifilum thermophilum]|uniref:indole-3-glycerol-phosphate synthase n=1 Tax=Thermoflavifilum thermophilum TaxID=1393122 RepID=A0A1I7NH17_9BACT|nr:indole-3-glycerol phosphate synthase TrpC [Thermoflavifilum thermophilum]SFV33967.1 indole-3-glycerol phosphate synthase [Thermoflavifilum thermophilum]
MAFILDTIIAHKHRELAIKQQAFPLAVLQQIPAFKRTCFSLKQALLRPFSSGIIAEHKRKSPSKGYFASTRTLEQIVTGYAQHGAAALSILTDMTFFGGSGEDLMMARAQVSIPLLRKDFIIDPYQVYEAKALGADVILLIAECLDKKTIQSLSALAHELGLEVLMEVHSREQLDKWCADVDLIGINNRDLRTFEVDLNRSFELVQCAPPGTPVIAESGIHDPQIIASLRQAGCKGFLIGERFMHQPDPVQAFQSFILQLQQTATHA